MDPKTTNPETIDPKINACRKLINLTDSLLREEISGYVWFDMLSQDLYILRVIAKAYAISADLEEEYRIPAVIMYLFAHCGAPEMGIRAINRLGPGIPILFYIEIHNKRKELCPSTEVYTVMTHDGTLITRTSDGDELVDLDPICIHASAVTPEGVKRRVVYGPNKNEYGDEDYSWV
ncbi:MAG: hypothetical protein QW328_07245 [Nitrososphaerota archaeon]